MIVVCGTLVETNNISRSFFFKILILRIVSGVKEQNWAKMTKNSLCLTPYLRNLTSYNCDLWYTCVNDISSNFFHFSKILIFWVFRVAGGERAKNDLRLPISVCHALYLRNWRSYHRDLWSIGVKY